VQREWEISWESMQVVMLVQGMGMVGAGRKDFVVKEQGTLRLLQTAL
jgi:hypothetical protein